MTDPITNAEGLLVWLQDRAEKLDNDGHFNGANGTRLWADALNALLTERAVLREALTFYATAEAHEVDSDRGNVASKALKGVPQPVCGFCRATLPNETALADHIATRHGPGDRTGQRYRTSA